MAEAVVHGVEVRCVPENKTLPSLLASSEPGVNEQQLGLRCRFKSSTGETEEYPATMKKAGSGATHFSCCCPSEAVPRTDSARAMLVWGAEGEEEVACRVVEALEEKNAPAVKELSAAAVFQSMSLLDRYLAVWILLAMIIGVLLGYYVPAIRDAWETVSVANVSLPIAIGLWWMMYPVLCKVRFELLPKLSRSWGLLFHIGISLAVNWVFAPLLMTGLAWATLPDQAGLRSGIILVGIARCIAMVLIWNHLAGGNAEFCAILVAVNSILQVILYSPLAIFYIDVVSHGGSVDVSFWTVAKSVLIFLGVPLVAAVITRFTLRALLGAKWYDDKFLPWFGPTALIGLLFTIFVMFSLQGQNIGNNIGKVARVAVPLLIYFGIVFFSVLALCWRLGFAYCDAVTQSFTAGSNNFELAIAVAVASYGIGSDEALAAVVGPLIEVPVLIGLVYVTLWIRQKLQWKNNGAVLDADDFLEKE
ncbi:unnamed protein product [Closterium sp. NIES-64]|nr:unnamed protein product [Closterium sp. NIES-65]CAI5987743.1 unnamed protein product [Closterium sp. NIES-65]CAI6001893.1 unnamed protein product [Closterium sp. NIES-64]